MEKYKYKLYGAILGDLAGQPFEFGKYEGKLQLHNPDSVFTDDTIMTLASAQFMINRKIGIRKKDTIEMCYKNMGKLYNGDHYGKGFKAWLSSPLGTVNTSYGNGSIMKISPFMYGDSPITDSLSSILRSHLHEMSVESVIKLCDAYKNKFVYGDAHITNKKRFKVESDATIDLVLSEFENYPFSTQESILNIIGYGGDTDTNASILGELCNFYYKDLSRKDVEYVESKLDPFLLNILKTFNNIF